MADIIHSCLCVLWMWNLCGGRSSLVLDVVLHINLPQHTASFQCVGMFSGKQKRIWSPLNMMRWTNPPATTKQTHLWWSRTSRSRCQNTGQSKKKSPLSLMKLKPVRRRHTLQNTAAAGQWRKQTGLTWSVSVCNTWGLNGMKTKFRGATSVSTSC